MSKFNIVLVNPVIPQNTGSIARLCACTGVTLHLIHPLGFRTDDKEVKRAGLDYWSHVDIFEHKKWDDFITAEKPEKIFFFSKFSKRSFTKANFLSSKTYLVFGSEVSGLPKEIWEKYKDLFYTVPIRINIVRSLNLAQCVAIVLYEALRQNNFEGIMSQPCL